MTPSPLHFTVPDMDCGGCIKSIMSAIHQQDMTAKVEANLDNKIVTITGNGSAETYKSAIEDAGFTITTL